MATETTDGNEVTGLGSDAPAEQEGLEQEHSDDGPSNDSEDEDAPDDNASSDDSQKSPAEKAVENQERALQTGEELPG